MATTRVVRATRKDSDGDITHLCNSSEGWSPRPKSGAISDIEGGTIVYRVKSTSGPIVDVISGSSGKYLRSRPDSSTSDNLDNLPDC